MRIALVIDTILDPFAGGVERVSSLLCDYLETKGFDMMIISTRIDAVGEKRSGNIIDLTAPSADMIAKRLAEITKEEKIDLVVFQGINNFMKALITAKTSAGVKKWVVLHNQPFPLLYKERVIKRLTPSKGLSRKGKMLRLLGMVAPATFRKIYLKKIGKDYWEIIYHVDRFIVLSERYFNRITDVLSDLPPGKLIGINNPNTFPMEKFRDNGEGKENGLIFVGRLSHPQKNVTGFIDVWNLFHKRNPSWKAYILGEGEHRGIIERYARINDVKGLSFEGKRGDVERYYSRCKILCMTSTYEGWPMALNEAMSFGCVPVVFDTFEAVHDIITDGENGFIIKAFDYNAMASKMQVLASDNLLYDRLSENARERVKDFTIDKIGAVWERHLTSLMQ